MLYGIRPDEQLRLADGRLHGAGLPALRHRVVRLPDAPAGRAPREPGLLRRGPLTVPRLTPPQRGRVPAVTLGATPDDRTTRARGERGDPRRRPTAPSTRRAGRRSSAAPGPSGTAPSGQPGARPPARPPIPAVSPPARRSRHRRLRAGKVPAPSHRRSRSGGPRASGGRTRGRHRPRRHRAAPESPPATPTAPAATDPCRRPSCRRPGDRPRRPCRRRRTGARTGPLGPVSVMPVPAPPPSGCPGWSGSWRPCSSWRGRPGRCWWRCTAPVAAAVTWRAADAVRRAAAPERPGVGVDELGRPDWSTTPSRPRPQALLADDEAGLPGRRRPGQRRLWSPSTGAGSRCCGRWARACGPRTSPACPRPTGDRSWDVDLRSRTASARPTCQAVPLVVASSWELRDERLVMTDLEPSSTSEIGPRPWEVDDLSVATGDRVVVAARRRQRLAAAERGAGRRPGGRRRRPAGQVGRSRRAGT